MLTHKDRIRRTLRREPVDYVPSNLEFSGPLAARVAHALRVSVPDLLTTFDNHIVYAYLDDETRRDAGLIYDNWGVGVQEQEGAAIVVHPMADRSAAERYRFPDPDAPGLLRTVERAVRRYGSEYFVATYQRWLLFERACWLRGMENFLLDLVTDRPFAEWLLDRITDYQVAVARRCVASGADCGRTGDDWGTQRGMIFSPQLWRELIRPRLARIWHVYQEAGVPVMHHSCGDITPIVGDLADMGLAVLHPVQAMMPRQTLKAAYGDRLVFYGGIDCQGVVPLGSPEEVRAETQDAIRTLGAGGGLIIGLTHTLTSETPLENLRMLWETVREERAKVAG
ncbi:MAG: uroporphyrinogen decarboxylase family protein [Candidatus Methylomirabilales bacterium]